MAVLVATRKGAFVLQGDAGRRTWKVGAPLQLGHIVHHMVLDPRDRKTILMAARTGHLGPTVFRSKDGGKTWKEATRPPAFRVAKEGEKKHVVDHTFGSPQRTRASRNVGMRGLRRRGSSAAKTRAILGIRWRG